jgi:membrane protein YqaA with SNARE-associated domain
MDPLLGLFVASFTAATLIPLPSEAALFAYLKAYPEHTALAIAVATLGNTAGGMTSFFIGRLIPPKDLKGLARVQRYGAPATLLAWLPVAGDALIVAAGWLRMKWWLVLAFSAAGRLARYLVIAWVAN